MRSDGTAVYYFIQHRDSRGEWCASSLEAFLFGDLSFAARGSGVGARRRALLGPQQATSDLWQKFGIYGYTDVRDARAVLKELRAATPTTDFRIARRTMTQLTRVVT